MVMMWSPAGKSTRDVEHTAPGRGVEGEGWMVKREGEEGGWRGRSGW